MKNPTDVTKPKRSGPESRCTPELTEKICKAVCQGCYSRAYYVANRERLTAAKQCKRDRQSGAAQGEPQSIASG